jgi:hypothetical protein
MMQLSLRTLGGNAMSQGVSQISNINSYLPGVAR